MRPLAVAAVSLLLVACNVFAQDIDALKSLRREHPRLFATTQQFDQTKQLIQSDPLAKRWHAALVTSAEKIIAEPTAVHTLVGPRMLAQSRAALRRISTTAGLYRLDGDKRFLERAKKEMLASAAF